MAEEHNVNIKYRRGPPRDHPFLRLLVLLFAGAIIATVVSSHDPASGSDVLVAIWVLLIIAWYGGEKRKQLK